MTRTLTLIALLLSFTSLAQIQVSTRDVAVANKTGNLSDDEYEAIKNTTTIFILGDFDDPGIWEQAIKKSWTFTPYKIIHYTEASSYLSQKGYSYFSFGGWVTVVRGTSIVTEHTHLSYDLWIPSFDKNGKVKTSKKGVIDQNFYARILLYPDFKTLSYVTSDAIFGKQSPEIYRNANIYNWSPGLMAGYLSVVNTGYKNKDLRGPFTEDENDKLLRKLKTDTLYVPDYVNIQFNAFTGAEHAEEDDEPGDLKKIYEYPFKIVTTEELDRLVLNHEKPVYYLSYVKSSTDKFVSVFHSGTGEMIYSRYTKSYNFKNKDLGKLSKHIKNIH